MTNDDTTDGPMSEHHFDEETYQRTKELTDDANTDITRRRLCQALSALGATSLAGCNSPGGDGGGGGGNGQITSATPTPIPSAADMDDLIDAHVAAIRGQSYTIGAELQGGGTDPDIKKEIEYLRSTTGEPFVSLTEVSTIDDGVESLTHYFTPDFHGVDIGFVDGTSNAESLDISTRVIEITGASVFDRFLVGAAVEEPTTRTSEDTGEEFERYQIKAHRKYDLDRGFVVVDTADVIRRFRLDWTDGNGIERWVDAEIYDIGSTDVNIPEF